MKKIIFTLLFVLSFMLVCMNVKADEYIPSYSIYKQDNMEQLNVPDSTPLATADYVWGYTNLLWAETNNVKETTNPNYVLNGSKSMIWSPGAGDAEGWTASSVGIGISPNKMQGTNGGYLMKLSFLVLLEDIDTLVVKAFDSNNQLRQELVLKDTYEKGEDPGYHDKDPETVINVEKITGSITYAKVDFIIRSSVTLTTYYTFVVKSKGPNAKVVLDDLTVYKENDPEIEHRDYQNFVEENFEKETVGNTIFDDLQTNVKEAVLDTENPIKGNKSLVLKSQTQSADSFIRSKNINLDECFYKLYFKFSGNLVNLSGIYIKKSDDNSIVYDFILNPTTMERSAGVINHLFDASSSTVDASGANTCYGEFEITEAGEYYIEIYFKLNKSYVSTPFVKYDEISLLKQYQRVKPETYPSNDPEMISGEHDATPSTNTNINTYDVTLNNAKKSGCGKASIFYVFLFTAGMILLIRRKK